MIEEEFENLRDGDACGQAGNGLIGFFQEQPGWAGLVNAGVQDERSNIPVVIQVHSENDDSEEYAAG